MNPRFAEIDIFPKFRFLSFSAVMSARYALATDIFPPVSPSNALAKKRTARGRVKVKAPRIFESTLKRGTIGRKRAPEKDNP